MRIYVGVIVSAAIDVPVCRRVVGRVHSTIMDNRLGTNSNVPSVEILTGRLTIDIVAAGHTCRRLRGRNMVRSIPKHKFCIYRRGGSLLHRGRVVGLRGEVSRLLTSYRGTKVALGSVVSVIHMLKRGW